MAHTIINPGGLHDPAGFGCSHVACAPGDLVFTAGQHASDGEGHVTSPDFAEQAGRSLGNLRTALTAAGLGHEDKPRPSPAWPPSPCPPCSSRPTPSPSASDEHVMQAPGSTPGMITPVSSVS
ncbi:MAG TPA: RidA family protein [Streptosporangiaceae bacterium]|nr:RidA family protein [Streptosporangiaceae bacterium]